MNWFSRLFLLASNSLYGGQAVIGGVMMKGKTHYAISVNTPSGLQSKTEEFHSISEKLPFLKWPFIRGVVNLVEMMFLGYKSLDYAADKALADDEESESSSLGFWAMLGTFLFSLLFAIFLFKLVPLSAAQGLKSLIPEISTLVFNLVDGVVKLIILVGYLLIISRIPDIKDVFRYHGAEHKTINCYEANKPLTIKNIASFSTVHKRCGTTFIFVVIFFSIVVYIAFFTLLEYLYPALDLPFVVNLALRIALLPFIASVSYELQRYSASRSNFFIRALVAPGLLLQKITTNEPSPKHIRAAKQALNLVIKAEEN